MRFRVTSIVYLLIAFVGYLLGSCPGRAADDPFLRVDASGHNAPIRTVLFSPDGKKLFSAGYDKVVRVWDGTGAKKEPLASFRYDIGVGDQGQLTATAISPLPANPLLVLGVRKSGTAAEVLLINYETGQVMRSLLNLNELVTTIRFSADGTSLAVGTRLGKIVLFKIDGSGVKETKSLRVGPDGAAEGDYISGLAFSPDNRQIVAACSYSESGSRKGYLQFYETTNGKKGKFVPFDAPVLSVEWASDGNLACGMLDGIVAMFAPGVDETRRPFPSLGSSVNSLAYHPNTQQIVTAGGEIQGQMPTVHVRSSVNNREISTFNEHKGTVFTLAISPDGKRVASADAAGRMYLWKTDTGELLTDLSGGGEALGRVAWSPDGKQLVWGDLNPAHSLSLAFDLQQIQPQDVAPDAIWKSLDLLKNESGLSLNYFFLGRTIQVKRGSELVCTIDTKFNIICCGLTPAGEVIVGTGGGLVLYNTQGNIIATFQGHEGAVNAIAISPVKPNYLATVSNDRTVRIWSLEAGARRNGLITPLLSLFVADKGHWVAWTPPGYYYGSPDGEKLIGWHLNQGPTKPALFLSTDNFKNRYRRRDLIPLVVQSGDVQQGIVLYNQDPQKKQTKLDPVASIAKEATQTPTVEMRQVDMPAIKLADLLHWKTDKPQATVRIHINGVANQQQANLKLSRPFLGLTDAHTRALELKRKVDVKPDERVITVDLVPGPNEIRLQASAPGNDSPYGAPLTCVIEYTPPANQDARGALYALAVGIQDFDDPKINGAMVMHTVDDAKGIVKLCKENTAGLYKSVTVKSLYDKEATPKRVVEEITGLVKQAGAGDTILIYLSTHGVPPPKGGAGARGGSTLYFAMRDTKLTDQEFFNTSLACDDLLKAINENVNEATRVILVLDTCYSATFADATAYNDTISTLREHMYVLTSCDINEQSLEDNKLWKHGLFTGALLEALSMNAEPYRSTAPDGSLTLFDLEFYVKRRVRDRVTKDAMQFGFRKQNPMLYGPGDRYFPLFKAQ